MVPFQASEVNVTRRPELVVDTFQAWVTCMFAGSVKVTTQPLSGVVPVLVSVTLAVKPPGYTENLAVQVIPDGGGGGVAPAVSVVKLPGADIGLAENPGWTPGYATTAR